MSYLQQHSQCPCILQRVTACRQELCCCSSLSTNRDCSWVFLLPQLHIYNSTQHLQGIIHPMGSKWAGAHRSLSHHFVEKNQKPCRKLGFPTTHTPLHRVDHVKCQGAKLVHQKTCASMGTKVAPSPPAGNIHTAQPNQEPCMGQARREDMWVHPTAVPAIPAATWPWCPILTPWARGTQHPSLTPITKFTRYQQYKIEPGGCLFWFWMWLTASCKLQVKLKSENWII